MTSVFESLEKATLLPSGAESADTDDLLACISEGDDACLSHTLHKKGLAGTTAAAACGDDPDAAAAVAENEDDWAFLLDALDAFEQPPASCTSAQSMEPGATGRTDSTHDNNHQQQQQQQQLLKRETGYESRDTVAGGPAGASAAASAAAAGGCAAVKAEPAAAAEVKSEAGPPHQATDSCSPGHVKHSTAQHAATAGGPGAPAASATASGDADSNSAAAAVAWASSGGGVARFSWAEDNSPLLAATAADPDADVGGASLSGGNTHSPSSAGGAHSSVGASSRAAAHGSSRGQQQQQQQGGSSSTAHWGLPSALAVNPDEALGRQNPGGLLTQHPTGFTSPGSGMSMGMNMGSMAMNMHGYMQQQQQMLIPTSSSQQYHDRPYQGSAPGGFLNPDAGLGPQGLLNPGSQQPNHRQSGGGVSGCGRVVNQFAVPGSPCSSPVTESLRAAGYGGEGVGLGPGPLCYNSQPGMSSSRSVMSGPQPPLRQWSAPCPCCPPGLNLHSSGHMMMQQQPSGPMMPPQALGDLHPHGLGFSIGPLNPDWRSGPHSAPMVQMEPGMGRALPPHMMPQYHMPPHSNDMRGPVAHMSEVGGGLRGPGQQVSHMGHMGPGSSHMGGGQTLHGSMLAAPGGAAAGSAGGAAGVQGSGLPVNPTDLGNIHPAALSQFGVPEETFPVMVGPPKRKRGRPRKHPLPEVAAAATKIAAAAAAVTTLPPAPGFSGGGGPMNPVQSHLRVAPQQHQLALQQQQQQQMLMHQHQMQQIKLQQQLQVQQQQQQQRQMMAGPYGRPPPHAWAVSAAAAADASGGGGGGNMSWPGGVPDSPFSPLQAPLKRQKSQDLWGL